MDGGQFKGKMFRFKLGKTRIIIGLRLIDICTNSKGRTIIFPWARYLK